MHLGLIGGIGPAATVVYYQRLTELMRQRNSRLELTIVQAHVYDLLENNLADQRDAQAAIYADLITRLKAAGADCAAITSLGGHFCFAETAKISTLPLISAVTPLDDYFAAQGLKRVGLLGTGVVMRTQLYGQLIKTKAIAPDSDLGTLGKLYQDMAVSGTCTDAQRAIFFEEGRKMVEDQGAEAIILAGTDLNLAFDGQHNPGYPVIDALDVHVAVLADLASGATTIENLNAGQPTS